MKLQRVFLQFIVFIINGCAGIPEGISPASNFNLDPYLGAAHEIARLDNRFEKGVPKFFANYGQNSDGAVRDINRGLLTNLNPWVKQ